MTKAYKVAGLRKLYIADFANVNDFVKRYEGELDFIDYWKAKKNCLTPFCFDYKNKAVAFVETPSGINLAAAHPFFYEAQRHHATKLFLVPFNTVKSLMREVDGFGNSKPLFLFSTGRCGSTLLCNLMGDNANIVSVSEPDYFTQLPFLRYEHGVQIDGELVQLTRGLTLLLQAYISTYSNDATTVFKLRSMCTEAAELIADAIPEADHIFLYRNANDTINSFLSVLSVHPLLFLARGLNSKFFPLLNHIPIGLISYLPGLRIKVEILAPLIKESVYRKLGIGTGTSIFALAWLSSLDTVLALQRAEQAFFKCVVRYDELRTNTFDIMAGVMVSLGLGEVDEPAQKRMRQTLEKDSQAGSDMSSKGEKVLSDKDLGIIESVLKKHLEIRSANYLLPNSVGELSVVE